MTTAVTGTIYTWPAQPPAGSVLKSEHWTWRRDTSDNVRCWSGSPNRRPDKTERSEWNALVSWLGDAGFTVIQPDGSEQVVAIPAEPPARAVVREPGGREWTRARAGSTGWTHDGQSFSEWAAIIREYRTLTVV